MLLLLLFYILLLVWLFYDIIEVKIAEIALLEPSKILRLTNNAVHLRIVLEGKNYDIWVPYELRNRKPMLKLKVRATDADNKVVALSLYPGCLPSSTVTEMGYHSITIKSAGRDGESKTFHGDVKLAL